jgi:MFS family permease
LYVAAALVLLALGQPQARATVDMRPPRPLAVVARQPVYWIAVFAGLCSYAVMSFIMTATPISMHVVDGMSVSDTKRVISTHLLGMYLPSLASGWIIRVLGIRPMMLLGLACMGACIVIGAFVGHHFLHYFTGLLLLGVGWNFLFVAGTTLLTTSYSPSERFKAQGLNDLVVFGTQACASLLAGPAITYLTWRHVNLLGVPLLLAMAAAVWWLGRQRAATQTA